MAPPLGGVAAATARFQDPAVRAQVRGWHVEGVSLLDMVDRLELEFETTTRDAIAALTADEVQVIRDAFLAEIDRAGDSDTASLPVDCAIATLTGPVAVSRLERDGTLFARVDEAPRAS